MDDRGGGPADVLSRLPGDVVCLVGPDGRPTWVSPAVTRTFGYEPADFLTRTTIELIHPDDRDFVRDTWAASLSAGPDVEVVTEFRILAADGKWRWVECIGANLLDDPSVRAVVMNFRDVTERHEAEDALRASESALRTIIESTTDGLILVDPLARVRWCSPAIEDVLGYPPDEVLGAHIMNFVHPADLATALPSLERTLQGRSAGEPLSVRVKHADGEWRNIEALSKRVRGGDSRLGDGAMFSIRDVTKRVQAERALRKSEARLAQFLRNSKDLTGLVGVDGTIQWMSSTVTDMLGYDLDEIVGMNAFALIHPDDITEAVDRFGLVVAGSGSPAPLTLRVRKKDGSWLVVEGLGSMMEAEEDDDGESPGLVINVRDVTWRLAAEEAVRRTDARFRVVMQNHFDVTAVVDREGVVKWVTPNAVRLLGWDPDEVIGKSGLEFIHPDDLEYMIGELVAFSEGRGVPNPTPIQMRHNDGTYRHVEVVGTDFLGNPEVEGIAVTIRDVTERVAAERDRKRLTDIFGLTTDLVSIGDSHGRLVYLNDASRQFFGIDPDADVASVDITPQIMPWSLERMIADIVPSLDEATTWSGELELIAQDGTVVPVLAQLMAHHDADGKIEYISSVLRDISERKAFELRLEHAATHDPLTHLPNRALLIDRLGMALARSRRRESSVAVLFCDLDHFKVVNDSLGHSRGDDLLVEVAQRLSAQMRPSDTVSRFGGDEFVILCEDVDGAADAVAVAKRAEKAVSRGMMLGGTEVQVGMSMGIAVAEHGIADPETLIREADAAMYRAKARGRGRHELFEPNMWAQAVDRFDLENALRRALDHGELELYYQPIVSLRNGREVSAVEALLRWQHPQRGWLTPDEFIPVAEETGLVLPIGRWVLEQACTQMRRWQENPDMQPIAVAVNISGRQLAHSEFVDEVARLIEDTAIDPARLHLEITESVLMDDVAASAAVLDDLHELGVRLAVDDFGTGYSSLSYLKRFPIDTLKVDRSFVDGLGSEPEDSAIVAAIVNLAHTLGMDAIGEGVETAAQMRALESLGCDGAQGFLLAEPLPVAMATEHLIGVAPT